MSTQPKPRNPDPFAPESTTTRLQGLPGGKARDFSQRYTARSFARISATFADLVILYAIYRGTDKNLLHTAGAQFLMQGLMVAILGQTPGSFIFHVRIVDDVAFRNPKEGYVKPAFLNALLRGILFPVTAFAGFAFLNPKRRTPLDLVSGTRAVQEEARAEIPVKRTGAFLVLLFIPLIAAAVYSQIKTTLP